MADVEVARNGSVADRVEKALEGWPCEALDEVERLAELVRSANDAGAVLRLGYTSVFAAVPEADWGAWDDLSHVIVSGWDMPDAAPVMVRSCRLVGRMARRVTDRVDQLSPEMIGRFGWGVLMLGVLGFALARRARELAGLEQAVAAEAEAEHD